MKRIAYLITGLAVTFSLTACGPRNTAWYRNNNRTNQGSSAGSNISNQAVALRDGVYTGTGDGHANGNENATVTVRNGRISDVVLASLDKQGNIIKNYTGTNYNNANPNASPGPNTGNTGTTANSGNAGASDVTGIGNQRTGTGYNQNGYTVNKATEGNTTNNTGTAAGSSAIDQLKSRLTTSILQNQTHDVNLDGIDGSLSSTFNNWKLAVKRALDQAR